MGDYNNDDFGTDNNNNFGIEFQEPEKEEERPEEQEQEEEEEIAAQSDEGDETESKASPDDFFDEESPIKKQFNRIRREKYQLENQLKKLMEENEQMRQYSQLATQASMENYKKAINADLDEAKRMKAMAMEVQDTEASIQADEMLQRTLLRQAEAEKWENENKINYQTQQPTMQQYQQQQEEMQAQQQMYVQQAAAMEQQWLNQNPTFNPNSPQFNKNIANELYGYVNNINAQIMNSGITPDWGKYFGAVDDAAAMVMQKYRGRMPMRNNNSRVAGVSRGGYGVGSGGSSSNRPISSFEKALLNHTGISESDWVNKHLAPVERRMRNNPRYNAGIPGVRHTMVLEK